MSTTTGANYQLPSQPVLVASHATRLSTRIARLAFIAMGLVGTAAASGAAYESIAGAGDAAAYPPAGRLVDVGGYRLHLDCRGEGSPTIVMDAGLGASSLDGSLVQPALASTTRACAYDRAGMGWSDAGPEPRSPSNLARELHLLLKNADIAGPYILVGHSLAGKTVRMFAAAYPADVAGIVLVDARSEKLDRSADADAFATALEAQAAWFSLARKLGVVRLLGGAVLDLPLVPAALASQMALLGTTPAAIAATTWEGLSRAADDEALAETTLGTVPLTVVAAGENMNEPEWAAAQEAMVRLSTDGQMVVAAGSGHAVHLEDPALVIDAAGRQLDEIRRNM